MREMTADDLDPDDPAEQGRRGDRDMPPEDRPEYITNSHVQNKVPEEPRDERQSER